MRELLHRVQGEGRGGKGGCVVPSGLAALDTVLPSGGLPAGAVTEVLYEGPGSGALSLAVRFACRAAGKGGYVIFVDVPGNDGDLYPPALVQAGLRADRLVIVRPATLRDAAWACRQSLCCRGVAAVVAGLERDDHDLRVLRRFQLAAERGQGIGLLLRPIRGHGPSAIPRTRTFAAVQLLVENAHRLYVLKTREGRPAEPIVVELGDEASHVPLHAVAERPAAGRPRRLATA